VEEIPSHHGFVAAAIVGKAVFLDIVVFLVGAGVLGIIVVLEIAYAETIAVAVVGIGGAVELAV
jgi:hypothetical protein